MRFKEGYFNSQPHKEADKVCQRIFPATDISTHSLTRRLTSFPHIAEWVYLYFNSQPHKEADLRFISAFPVKNNFNSQPHKEADCCILLFFHISFYFNSQPHKEADDIEIVEEEARVVISTHSLTRRLTAISDKNIFIQNWFFYLLYILVLFFIQIIIF